MNTPLYMLRLPVDLNMLAKYAGERGWIIRKYKNKERSVGFDEGKALHHMLDEAFGPELRPFRMMVAPHSHKASLYAYTRTSQDELEQNRKIAFSEFSTIFGRDPLDFNQMPESWTKGRRLAFNLRIRPISRLKKALPNPRDPNNPYKAGAELDAFFVEAMRNYPDSYPRIVDGIDTPSEMLNAGRTREAVYLDWLETRLGEAATLNRHNAATRMTKFLRTRVARNGRPVEGPDATIQGELTVQDPQAFASLLSGGIGRHKAYGYGMFLLRPPRRTVSEV